MKKMISLLAVALLSASNFASILKSGDSIAFLGDSITDLGWTAWWASGYVKMCERVFHERWMNVKIYPAGKGGHKSNDMLARLDRDVISKKPTYMTLSCGVNDVMHQQFENGIYQKGGVLLPEYKANIRQIIEKAQAAGIQVIVLTSTMIQENVENRQNKQLIDYNNFLREIAKEKGCTLVDLSAEMQKQVAEFRAKTGSTENYLTNDGVHMDFLGNRMMALKILKDGFQFNEEEMQSAEESISRMIATFSVPLAKVSGDEFMRVSERAKEAKMSAPHYARQTLQAAAERAAHGILAQTTMKRFVTGVSYTTPARNYEESLVTGSGNLGAMVRGRLTNEIVSLSHYQLYRPTPGTQLPVLNNLSEGTASLVKRRPGDQDRDRFMGACELRIGAPLANATDYSRRTEFATGECVVEATVDGQPYERRVVALRPSNVIAVKINDEGAHDHLTTLNMITYKKTPMMALKDDFVMPGLDNPEEIAKEYRQHSVRKIVSGYDYYRCEYACENPWNPFAGYEVLCVKKVSADKKTIEMVLAIEPYKKGETTHRPAMQARLEKALAKGYDALVAEHVVGQSEIMNRVSFELEGPKDADQIMRNFQSGRYNIISSTGGDHIPNLQGVWAGAWESPWCGSYTFNGNLPAAISFFSRGRTTEFNECLLRWIEKRLPDMREAAKFHHKARGFRIPCHATSEGGIEVNSSEMYPHIFWHGGTAWMLSRLFDGYRHTLDKEWLKRIYPLMKEQTGYYEDVLVELGDGTLGFNPSYSPENWPGNKSPYKGGPVTVNATMDNAIAKQFLDEVIKASEILGVDEGERAKWAKLRARLRPFALSTDGFFAEWLAPNQSEQNEHRHASHLYPLFDNAPAEILTNAALTAGVKKTIKARMSFNERGRSMAYGYVQNGLAACKIKDGELAARCLQLLTDKNWLPGGGSSHDWYCLFNTDISGGYTYLIADMLVWSDDSSMTFLPAKPKSWTSGAIRGLHLRGNIILEELSWRNNSFKATLKLPTGEIKKISGQAGLTYAWPTGAK